MTSNHPISSAAPLSGWRKSSYSGPEAGSCLEVLDDRPSYVCVPIRDSKNPHGPAVSFSASSWSLFVTAVKHGELPA